MPKQTDTPRPQATSDLAKADNQFHLLWGIFFERVRETGLLSELEISRLVHAPYDSERFIRRLPSDLLAFYCALIGMGRLRQEHDYGYHGHPIVEY